MYMLSYAWPLALVVTSNIVYQVCAKSMPESMNPFASLTIIYLIGTLASAARFFVLGNGASLFEEYRKMNWAPVVMGLVVVGLEAGWIYAYKAGWQVSTGFIVQSAFLAVGLLVVGHLLFGETIGWNKVVGVILCLIGLGFINYR